MNGTEFLAQNQSINLSSLAHNKIHVRTSDTMSVYCLCYVVHHSAQHSSDQNQIVFSLQPTTRRGEAVVSQWASWGQCANCQKRIGTIEWTGPGDPSPEFF